MTDHRFDWMIDLDTGAIRTDAVKAQALRDVTEARPAFERPFDERLTERTERLMTLAKTRRWQWLEAHGDYSESVFLSADEMAQRASDGRVSP